MGSRYMRLINCSPLTPSSAPLIHSLPVASPSAAAKRIGKSPQPIRGRLPARSDAAKRLEPSRNKNENPKMLRLDHLRV